MAAHTRLRTLLERWLDTPRLIRGALYALGFGGVLLAGLSLASCLVNRPMAATLTPELTAAAPVVRVALVNDARGAHITIGSAFEVFDPTAPGDRLSFDGLDGEVSVTADGVRVGQMALSRSRVRFAPAVDASIEVNGTAYHGELELLHRSSGEWVLINVVDLESYLAGVIGSEMPLDWNAAALRAQAIAARTYAVFQLKTRGNQDYDLETDDRSQVYKGLAAETEVSRRVVAETAGIILTYDWKLFCTYFHSTCGGSTTSARIVFDGPDIAPLNGTTCGYCRKSRYYSWDLSLPLGEVARLLGTGPISAIEVEHGPDDRAREVLVSHSGGTTSFDATRFRRTVGARELRSTFFDLMVTGGNVEIRGHGWGHGVGMCQVGANGMADAGFQEVDILRHYYPGSELARLYDVQ